MNIWEMLGMLLIISSYDVKSIWLGAVIGVFGVILSMTLGELGRGKKQ